MAQLAMQANCVSFSCSCSFRACTSIFACCSASCRWPVGSSRPGVSSSLPCCASVVSLEDVPAPAFSSCSCNLSFWFSSCSYTLWQLATCLVMANSLLASLSCSCKGPMSATPFDLAIFIHVCVRILSSSNAKKSGMANFWGIILPASRKV